ncbi:MAG: T9SS type A sorting domain-containing protein [Bacteroidota bacterium]
MRPSVLFYLLSALFVIFSHVIQAQYMPEPFIPEAYAETEGQNSLPRSGNAVIWHEDFDGELPEGWTSENANGFCAFQHTYDGPQGPFSVGMPPLDSETAANGFMILDTDLCTSQDDTSLLADAWLQSPPITIPDNTSLMLTFEHNFRYCCSLNQTVMVAEVSTDGENWTSFDVRNGLSPNNTSPNPVYQAINISHLTQGETQVWIRFRQAGTSHYWWMIDDVKLSSFVENDLEITHTTGTDGYAVILAGQQQPMALGATVKNTGGEPQTDVELSLNINEYLLQNTLTHAAIDPSQQVEMVFPETFTAPGRGNYTVNFSIDQLQEDMVPENNNAYFSFSVMDTVYSRTLGKPVAEEVLVSEAGSEFGAGNRYQLFEAAKVTSVSFTLDTTTVPGTLIYAKVYRINEGTMEEIIASEPYLVEEPGTDEPVGIVLPFAEADSLEAGQYLAAVYAAAQDGTVALSLANAQDQPQDASWIFDGEQWQPSTYLPFIDMHFGSNSSECSPAYHFVITNSLCGTESGSVEVIPLTGFAPYTFTWDTDPENNSSMLEGLMAGSYPVTITDANGCESTHSPVVEDEDISVSFTMTPALCDAGGTIELAPVNGTAPYVFSWEHDPALEGAIATGLSSGIYNVTITDANDCSILLPIEVENITELPVTVAHTNAFCTSSSGSIELTPEAGEAPYTYHWEGYDNVNQPVLEDLPAGTYSFTVSDANNCQFSGSAIVEQDEYELQSSVDLTHASCGLENGMAEVQLFNGQEPFVFQWSDGSSQQVASDLAPGFYEVVITDDFGCTATQSFEVDNFGQMPEVVWEVINSEDCGMAGGSLTIQPADPEAVYVYELIEEEGGETHQRSGLDSNGFLLDSLAAGQYLVGITNDDGCQLVVAVNVSDAGAPQVTADVQNVTCFGYEDGAISLSLEGADPQFQWDNDDNSTTPSIENLAKGVYTVMVTDGDCTSVVSYTIEEPEQLLATATINHIICANEDTGSILLDVAGGTPPYTYIWSNGQSERDLLDVDPGNYSVSVRDFNECLFQQAYELEGNEPLVVEAVVNHADDGEDNGMIVLTVSGGTGSYTFNWSHGAQSSVVTDLAPGAYTVTITDEAGCEVIETWHVGTLGTDLLSDPGERFAVYPNPARETIHIKANTATNHQAGTYEVEIMNVLGGRVLLQEVTLVPGHETATIALSQLHKGVYILRISGNGNIWQTKFVKK